MLALLTQAAPAFMAPGAMRPLIMPHQQASVVRMMWGSPQDADQQLEPEFERVRGLNRVAKVELELIKTQEENRELRERADPSRRATFVLPFAAVVTWSAYKTVSAPYFDFAGLDNLKELYRSTVVDEPAERSQNLYFPSSLSSSVCEHKVARTLESRGFYRENTLFATATCPDEVNTKVGQLCDLFKTRYGENFALGGLGGVPFTGKAGFSAYAHHVPDKGKMFIVFAPHVGIEFDGNVGTLQRENQGGVSTACGAAVGAFNAVMKEALEARNKAAQPENEADLQTRQYEASSGVDPAFDAQITFIKSKLKDRLADGGVERSPNKMAYVTYMMYLIVREFFIDEILSAPGLWDDGEELAVLGGIMINRGKGGDRFMPLMFQSRQQADGTMKDLYRETFGARPDLISVLGEGNRRLADSFNDYDLDNNKLKFAR